MKVRRIFDSLSAEEKDEMEKLLHKAYDERAEERHARRTEEAKKLVEDIELLPDEEALVDMRRKIFAIKAVRQRTGLPLMASKMLVDRYIEEKKNGTPTD